MPSNTQFSKPLFINGNFNRSGSRSRFVFVSLLPASPYDLRIWRRDGAPDNSYPQGANDTHFLYVDIDGWMIPIGLTAARLEAQAGRHFLTVEQFGGDVGAFWKEWTNCKTPEEREAFNAKYDPLEKKYGQDPARQGAYISAMLDDRKKLWQEAKENPQKWPDCIGAAICGELDKWQELAAAYKARKAAQERAEAEERAAQEAAEQKEQEAREKAEIAAYMALLRKSGRVADGKMAVKVADALGVKIPLRTRGFMLEKLAAFYVEEDGHVERMQYYRMGGRKYTGEGIYKTLTDICMAAREKVCA